MPFEKVPTSSNRSERLPCVFVVDASGSMVGEPIQDLNNGLAKMEAALKANDDAKRRVRVMVIEVSGSRATKIVDWVDAEDFTAPKFVANGGTPLGDGVRIALDEIKTELQRLKNEGIARKKPWLWIFTDGEPSDENWEEVANQCRQAHAATDVLVYPVAVGSGANVNQLGKFAKDNNIYQINATAFEDLFEFISRSAISGSAKAGQTTVTPLFAQITG